MKQTLILLITGLTLAACMGSTSHTVSREQAVKDSTRHAKQHADSLKWEHLFSIAQYPYVKGSKWSGIIPVTNPTEIPDTNHEYKLLFEYATKNPDSLAKDINTNLDEVARVLNLHYASGIPAKKIIPVVVIHGRGMETLVTDEVYRKKHSIDNPNLKLVHDLMNVGTKFIVCGQAMAFFEFVKEDFIPEVKVSLTAQTVLSNYQSKGYVLYSISPDK